MQGPSAGFGGQAGWPSPKPAFFVLGLFVSFLNYKYNIMIVVGTETLSGGRARASKRVAMQACTVDRFDRFPVPYRNRTIFPF